MLKENKILAIFITFLIMVPIVNLETQLTKNIGQSSKNMHSAKEEGLKSSNLSVDNQNLTWGGVDAPFTVNWNFSQDLYEYGLYYCLSSQYPSYITADSSGNVYIAVNMVNNVVQYFQDPVILIAKFNHTGDMEWYRIFGIFTRYSDCCGIKIDSTGNIYIAGSLGSSYNQPMDIFLAKYNPSGSLLWNKTWGYFGDDNSYGFAFDTSNNIVVGGFSNTTNGSGYQLCLIKYDPEGNQLMNATWGAMGDFSPLGLAFDTNNYLYMAGYSTARGNVTLVKFTNFNTRVWKRTFPIALDQLVGICIDQANNIYIGGFGWSYGLSVSVSFLIKYDDTGSLLWNCTSQNWGQEVYNGMASDSSGNIFIVGEIFAINQFNIVKLGSDGTKRWSYQSNMTSSGQNLLFNVAVDSSNNIYLIGSCYSGLYVAKIIENPGNPAIIQSWDMITLLCLIGITIVVKLCTIFKKSRIQVDAH